MCMTFGKYKIISGQYICICIQYIALIYLPWVYILEHLMQCYLRMASVSSSHGFIAGTCIKPTEARVHTAKDLFMCRVAAFKIFLNHIMENMHKLYNSFLLIQYIEALKSLQIRSMRKRQITLCCLKCPSINVHTVNALCFSILVLAGKHSLI